MTGVFIIKRNKPLRKQFSKEITEYQKKNSNYHPSPKIIDKNINTSIVYTETFLKCGTQINQYLFVLVNVCDTILMNNLIWVYKYSYFIKIS